MNDFYNTVYLSEHFDRQNRTQAEGQVDNSQILEPIEVKFLGKINTNFYSCVSFHSDWVEKKFIKKLSLKFV